MIHENQNYYWNSRCNTDRVSMQAIVEPRVATANATC